MEKTVESKIVPAKIVNYKCWIQCVDPAVMKHAFQDILEHSEFTVLCFNEHHFPVQGYTAFWLLAESHLAIHTFPQENWSYVELSSCNKHKAQLFEGLIAELPFELRNDSIAQSSPQ